SREALLLWPKESMQATGKGARLGSDPAADPNRELAMRTATILAIDLGKYKSVACAYRSGGEPSFATLASNPEALLRLAQRHRPGVVVVEAGLLAGWVHDLFVSAGFSCKVANTASDAWKFKHAKRKTDKDDALRLAQLEALGQLPAVAVPDPQT